MDGGEDVLLLLRETARLELGVGGRKPQGVGGGVAGGKEEGGANALAEEEGHQWIVCVCGGECNNGDGVDVDVDVDVVESSCCTYQCIWIVVDEMGSCC